MPMPKSFTILSNKDRQVVEELKEWVLTAEFRFVPDRPGVAICTDKELLQKQQLVAQMDLARELSRIRITIYRVVSGQQPFGLTTKTGPFQLIPLALVWRTSLGEPLTVGTAAHLEQDFHLDNVGAQAYLLSVMSA
ncbi:MAG: hypothetical protein M1823_003807 [Watsoniomyces obsoletus]|nr:MAG: hypothetical protein M1823_003807 [Watsoniomyces obsoletus]